MGAIVVIFNAFELAFSPWNKFFKMIFSCFSRESREELKESYRFLFDDDLPNQRVPVGFMGFARCMFFLFPVILPIVVIFGLVF